MSGWMKLGGFYEFFSRSHLTPPIQCFMLSWGGNGGGWGRDDKSHSIPWANEFQLVASMPCKTAEERQIRDRRAFLVHSLFVDVAIFRAVSALEHVMQNSIPDSSNVNRR
ncbi:hypothetical protein Droror1_Dr00011703 [Drosera rotundifolia]